MTAKRNVELRNRATRAPLNLAGYGVAVSMAMDHPVVPTRLLPSEEALKAVAISAAKVLGASGRAGTSRWEGRRPGRAGHKAVQHRGEGALHRSQREGGVRRRGGRAWGADAALSIDPAELNRMPSFITRGQR